MYPSRERHLGFTLLEMVVVLALVALLGAVIMPSLTKMQQAWKRRTETQDVANQLGSLGYRARLQSSEVVIGPQGISPAALLVLPSGWTLTASTPVVFHANGACLGGEAELSDDLGVRQHLLLEPPLCVPDLR